MRQQTKAAQTGWTAAGIVMICLLFFFAALLPGEASAAAKAKAKAPARTVITGADVNCNFVELQWEKARRATSYRVFVQTGKNGWKYWKSVKRTAKNKKKYSDTLKYKLKKSGAKYRIYKRTNPYRKAASGIKNLSYTYQGKYDTTCRFVVQSVRGKKLGPYSKAKTVKISQPLQDDSEKTAANAAKVKAYSDRLYSENIMDSYLNGGFTWCQESTSNGWLYYHGFMLEAFLHTDMEKYHGEIERYYDEFISIDDMGRVSIKRYATGALDSILPAVGMIDLLRSDYLDEQQKTNYAAAINWVYQQIRKQTTFPEAGNLLLHSQKSDGSPRPSSETWNIYLDGIYMSQIFLTRVSEAVAEGTLELTESDDTPANIDALWDDAYQRFSFVMENMCDKETGLPYHGYAVADKKVNGVIWSRGVGWFAMALLETAEKMPDPGKKKVLQEYYTNLMQALIAVQDPNTSLWYNTPNERENINRNVPETSGSAMFSYCLLRGYYDGLLTDEKFRTAGLDAFNSLVETKMTEEGLTGTLISMGVSSNVNAYQAPRYVTNEAKGIAPLLLAAKYAY